MLHPIKIALIAMAGFGLGACATETPYGPSSEGSGYGFSDQKIESNRYRVTFRGNSSTGRETVENYLLYRSAELTLKKGYDFFVVVEDDTEVAKTYRSTAPTYYGYRRPFPYYGYGYGWGRGYRDVDIRESRRYSAIAYILMGKGDKPNERAAYNAADVKANLEGYISRGDR
ncbi:MAG: hypothetical protein V3V30_03270 [Parvularculaceae bacterium]